MVNIECPRPKTGKVASKRAFLAYFQGAGGDKDIGLYVYDKQTGTELTELYSDGEYSMMIVSCYNGAIANVQNYN